MNSIFQRIASMDALSSVSAPDPSAMPSLFVYGTSVGENQIALPRLRGESLSFGVDLPIANGASSASIVALLQQGNAALFDIASPLCVHAGSYDAIALSIAATVSNSLVYVSDSSSNGIGDRWTCALATWARKYGDCEDGAILLHALLLSVGMNPNRVRTAFGTVINSSLTSVGHAWVMYRRESDEEWVPLDWTIQPTVYTGTVDDVKRQVDLTTTYTTISYVLTGAEFGPVSDANYISRLAANRSTGTIALPAFSANASTGPIASASLDLFKGVLATTLTATGQTGARASMTTPTLGAVGAGSQANTATGYVSASEMSVTATTGAMSACQLTGTTATGSCGSSAKADVALPVFALQALCTANALIAAELALPVARAKGTALAGVIVEGATVVQGVRVAGSAAQGPIAHGACSLRPTLAESKASILSICAGLVEFPPPAVRAQGRKTGRSMGVLRYDPKRMIA